MSVKLESSGGYAAVEATAPLTPFSQGRLFRWPATLPLPTQGVTSRQFPFDSAVFDLHMKLSPPIRPKVIHVRNFTPDFIGLCRTLQSHWDDSGNLSISIVCRRSPFVQYSATIFAVAALIFGLILVAIKDRENLAIVTASFFFSIWSIRSIITPSALVYSALLDFWLMGVSLIVLFLILWKLLVPRPNEVG
ncbi:MAG: hypothetical protein PHF00_01145 [Elusimicrobia bacterium]|nr:hypothetical protein [Elusimicrobiota bacterium]